MLCAGTRRLERRSDVPHRGCRLVGDAKRVVSPPRRHVPDRDESFRSRAESFLFFSLFFSEAEAPGEAAPGPFAGCQGLRAAPKTAPEARGRTNDARRQVVTSSGASLRQSSGQCPLTELSVTGVFAGVFTGVWSELSVTGVWSRIVRHRGWPGVWPCYRPPAQRDLVGLQLHHLRVPRRLIPRVRAPPPSTRSLRCARGSGRSGVGHP